MVGTRLGICGYESYRLRTTNVTSADDGLLTQLTRVPKRGVQPVTLHCLGSVDAPATVHETGLLSNQVHENGATV